MKSLILRSSVALACALSLAACGGGSGSLQLRGAVVGLTKDGLVLQNKGGDPMPIAAGQTSFVFPKLLANDEDYDVTIQTQPTGAHCDMESGKGRSGAFDVVNVVVRCTTNSYTLGGKIDHLDAAGLELVNGSDHLVVAAGATSFTFANKVFDGAPYGVKVLNQPTGRQCDFVTSATADQPSGTMGSANVANIQLACH